MVDLIRLRAQLVKELLSVLRDPRARLLLLVPPLMQLLIFSFAITLDVRNVGVAVLDHDRSPASGALLASVRAAGFVGQFNVVDNPQALQQQIDTRASLLAIRIPPDYSRKLARGEVASVQVILDGRRANSAQVALGYLEQIARQQGGALQLDQRISVRHWFNANLTYRWFVVPGLSGMLAMMVALLVTALSIARERELGTFEQLLVSPATALEIVLAKTLPALLLGGVLGSVMIAAAVLGFGVPLRGSPGLLLLALLLFMLSVVGVGLMVSAISSTQQQAILGTFALAVPMVLLSGFATPIDNMPPFLRAVAEVVPLRHYLALAHGSFLQDWGWRQAWPHLWPLLAIALLALPLAARLVRSKLQ